ncbi:MAG: SpoIID/LytB domain-containing protein [Actinobacteria bacterium]|nr:SpoIID/LytB domain-containing protein [Actinomycetota bacterium]
MRIRLAGLVSALLALLTVGAAPAVAGTTVVITGGGWGHGIGMSQYGAYGRALRGHSSKRILEHYYSGSSVTEKQMTKIRVGLLQTRSVIRMSPRKFRADRALITFHEQGVPGRITGGRPGTTFRIEPSGTGGMRIYKNGNLVKKDGRRVFGSPANPVIVRYTKHRSMVHVEEKNTSYAYGHLEVGSYQSSSCSAGFCLRLVAKLSMQKYLYGLGEVPSSWPDAALRSQAIAGRTYAYEKIRRLGQHRFPCDCAVYDSVIDQAYIGDSKRTGSGIYWDDWTGAVDATNREVILHNGGPIQALYSSSSGGHTENNENVWGGTPLPYLRGVPDGPDDVSANPNHRWKVEMSWARFEDEFQASYNIGELERFRIMDPLGVSGRVTVVKSADRGGVKIVGSRNTYRDSGWDIRSVLSLKDTLFKIRYKTTTNRNMRGAYDALDELPGTPVEPAYNRYDTSGRVVATVQHFENGQMVWNARTGDVTWRWEDNVATWSDESGELTVEGSAFVTEDCLAASCS